MEKLNRKEQILEMLKTEPNDMFLNYALAIEYIGNSDYLSAENQLLKTLEINSEYLTCFYQLGQVCEKLNKENDAINYYNKGIDLAKKQNNNKALGELKEALWQLED